MKLALIGFGNVGKSLVRLLEAQGAEFPFAITGIHTARHGTAYATEGLAFGPAARSSEEFLDRARADALVELTPLNPETGEPAVSHIRAAFARRMHAVTANKGPIAHAYASLRAEAAQAGVEFRFEAAVMDGAPVFNLVRNNLPGITVQGFTGVLNSTTSLVIAAMCRGRSMEDGIEEARRLGVTEADPAFDIDGWDSAVKGAALANVLMEGNVSPLDVDRRGIGRLTPERVADLANQRKTVRLVTRGRGRSGGVRVRVRAKVLDESDLLAAAPGTSNLILLHTDLMGVVGTVCVSPGVEQTAYGIFADLVDIKRCRESCAPASEARGESSPSATR